MRLSDYVGRPRGPRLVLRPPRWPPIVGRRRRAGARDRPSSPMPTWRRGEAATPLSRRLSSPHNDCGEGNEPAPSAGGVHSGADRPPAAVHGRVQISQVRKLRLRRQGEAPACGRERPRVETETGRCPPRRGTPARDTQAKAHNNAQSCESRIVHFTRVGRRRGPVSDRRARIIDARLFDRESRKTWPRKPRKAAGASAGTPRTADSERNTEREHEATVDAHRSMRVSFRRHAHGERLCSTSAQ
jgi:hypothetical protein